MFIMEYTKQTDSGKCRLVPVSNVIFSSKTDILSKIAILNFTCGVVLGLTIRGYNFYKMIFSWLKYNCKCNYMHFSGLMPVYD